MRDCGSEFWSSLFVGAVLRRSRPSNGVDKLLRSVACDVVPVCEEFSAAGHNGREWLSRISLKTCWQERQISKCCSQLAIWSLASDPLQYSTKVRRVTHGLGEDELDMRHTLHTATLQIRGNTQNRYMPLHDTNFLLPHVRLQLHASVGTRKFRDKTAACRPNRS